jgi:hypothetical protein
MPELRDAKGAGVKAVLFEDVDDDGNREVVVIADYFIAHHPDGGADRETHVSVVAYRDAKLERLLPAESFLAASKSAAEVRRELQSGHARPANSGH